MRFQARVLVRVANRCSSTSSALEHLEAIACDSRRPRDPRDLLALLNIDIAIAAVQHNRGLRIFADRALQQRFAQIARTYLEIRSDFAVAGVGVHAETGIGWQIECDAGVIGAERLIAGGQRAFECDRSV